MKRFWLFAIGPQCYGGMGDLLDTFDTEAEARSVCARIKETLDWHLFDSHEKRILAARDVDSIGQLNLLLDSRKEGVKIDVARFLSDLP